MPRWQRVYLCVTCGLIGFALAYVLCDYAAWPRLTYFPYEREWRWVAGPPGEIPMAYVGTLAWGLGGALVGVLSGLLGSVLFRRPLPDKMAHLLGAWAVSAFLYAGLYYTWNLWPF